MADATHPDDATARRLAEEHQLEYREPHAVAVDPRALSLLPAAECRRLRAVPLSTQAGSAVVAVADPSDGRLAEVRRCTGEGTRFVVIAERTLDALLSSRMFGAPTQAASVAQTPPVPREEAPPTEVAPPPSPPQPQQPQPQLDAQALADALAAALERRLPQLAPPPERDVPAEETSPNELVSRLDSALGAWNELRPLLDGNGTELEELRRALRETKEQLSVAHAELDQHRRRVAALETEAAEGRALLAAARQRLQETADVLNAGTASLEETRELL